ncbi:MAG: late competence development ComFB family protein [Gemmatimonadaceae bacterium]
MKNLLEGAVKDVYEELKSRDPSFCGCEQCEDDVLAFALNHLRPRYAGGTREGVAVTSVDLQRDQTRAELMVAVLDAMRRVTNNPRHAVGNPKRGGGAG